MSVITTVTVSMASAAGGSVAAAVASAHTTSAASAGGATLSLLASVQFFSLTSGASANLSDTYRALGCALQWANYRIPILGAGQRPQCASAASYTTTTITTSNSTTSAVETNDAASAMAPTSGFRRQLQQTEQPNLLQETTAAVENATVPLIVQLTVQSIQVCGTRVRGETTWGWGAFLSLFPRGLKCCPPLTHYLRTHSP